MSFAVFATAIISSMLINNVILMQFLGICPFLGVSKKSSSAVGMAGAVMFVMVIASAVTYTLYDLVLHPYNIPYISTIAFILVIASLVQLVEIVIKKYSTSMYKSLGIYLPLITTNCAILGISEANITNIWSTTTPFGTGLFIAVSTAFGTALGFGLVIFAFSSIRERLDAASVPAAWKGVPISLVVAGIMSLAFFGLAGIIQMWVPILLVASLITLYIGSYALNKSTPIPEECLEDMDTSKCSTCNIASCNLKE